MRRLLGRSVFEPPGQDGVRCLLLALLEQVNVLGLRLPAGYDAAELRKDCREWMLTNKTLIVDESWRNGTLVSGELPIWHQVAC